MRKVLFSLLASAAIAGCCQPKEVEFQPLESSVVYEMNLRQYTPEGTFTAAGAQLPRLKELGVDIVWLMPIYPIGIEGRKGPLGSYYSARNYCEVNPEFGTLEDFDAFLAEAHRLGMRVVLDWVANHTSPDAVWTQTKPADWYERDAEGNLTYTADWTDTANLNYDNKDMRAEMVNSMRFWMERGLDGFRCDMACEVPLEFWESTWKALRADYPGMYCLAEGEEPLLHSQCGFMTSYAWEIHHMLNDLAQGKKTAQDVVDYVARNAERFDSDASRLMFTSNHDENSWAGTEFERMGKAAKAMAVLCYTLPNSQPLIYTGQEVGFDHRFEFFSKDISPVWEDNEYTEFYKYMNKLYHENPALNCAGKGGSFEVIAADSTNFSFRRVLGDNVVTVSLDMAEPWNYEITAE